MMRSKSLFRDEHGFTTVGMVLALTISLSLIFMTAQVYRINSASAQVQDVADAAALAAENQVADFVLAARLCDAVILSLSLTGTVLYSVGVVALCVPPAVPVGEKLIAAGDDVIRARNNFANGAAATLDELQRALPFLAAVRAASVAAANNSTQTGAHYVGVGILVPLQGERIGEDWRYVDQSLSEEWSPQLEELKERSARSEELAAEAADAKLRAFERDCGDNPNYCQYERACALAQLAGRDNPLYTSVDAWSFNVALERARAYYDERYAIEEPKDDSIEEQVRSALRKRFYAYANAQLEHAYVFETDDMFEAYFPKFPRNTDEMRRTSLYTDAVFPITSAEDGTLTMHAWPGCPQATGSTALGSIAQLEEGGFSTCPICRFTASSMGSVASASTSISNGFEYHYAAIAREAQRYQKARAELDPVSQETKSLATSILEAVKRAFALTAANRIDPHPPGGIGAIALVVNFGELLPESGLGASFVSTGTSLGPRAAISCATLLEDHSDEGKTALNSLLDGIESQAAPLGVARVALDCWSASLDAYCEGQAAVLSVIEEGLNGVPLASASGLGTWAANKLKELMEGLSLQPARTDALKPVVVNSEHVADKSEDDFGQRYIAIKRQIITHPMSSTDLFDSMLSNLEEFATGQVLSTGDSIEVASIELFEGGVVIPVSIPLPQQAKDYSVGVINEAFGRIRSLRASMTGVSLWE